ncbi:hypothetical protein MMC31_003619, partial [Peltigera leucophlebia]|nr:hypothetical protein [Peltigera leucophlebia]
MSKTLVKSQARSLTEQSVISQVLSLLSIPSSFNEAITLEPIEIIAGPNIARFRITYASEGNIPRLFEPINDSDQLFATASSPSSLGRSLGLTDAWLMP